MESQDSSYLPGAAALIDQLDTVILVILRDGRNLVGILRSFDQYMNLVLEETSERISAKGIIFNSSFVEIMTDGTSIMCEGKYCDIPLGLFLVRGDNIVLLGEIDDEKLESQNVEKVSPEAFTEWIAQSEAKKLDWDFE